MATGRDIARKAISRMAKFQLEMGGKNPLVVLDDADLAVAVNVAVQGAFFSTGQRCTASSRLIVTEGIHDRFVKAVSERLASLRVGHALAPETEMGPVVERPQLDQDLEYITVGASEGARLAFGGERLKRETDGYYLAPALFVDATNAMRISREEIFGPVACVIRAKDYDEALAIANDTDTGPFRDRHHVAEARVAFQAARAGRHGDGEPADRRRGLSRPVRRPQSLQLRPARAGPLRRGVLHDGQDDLHRAVIDAT